MTTPVILSTAIGEGIKSLALRDPTVGDLIDVPPYAEETKVFDEKRRIETTTRTFSPGRFARFVARLAGIPEATAEALTIEDARRLRNVLDVYTGNDRETLFQIVDALTFDLEWPPSEVEAMTIPRLAHWYKRAADRSKRKQHNE